jgi:glycosyltransferase involved in cell wall biosynthesis
MSRLLDEMRLSISDHVLIHTLSIAELHSLIAALVVHRDVPRLHIVLRRDADETAVQSDVWGGIRNAFARLKAEERLAARFRFYSDTSNLCKQYEALSYGVPIKLLPIPSHPFTCANSRSYTSNEAVCATYLGDARIEKGFHCLPKAVQALSASHLENGRLRFVVQANVNFSLETAVIMRARRHLATYGPDKVQLLTQPLSTEEFNSRLFEADLILLPYQADHYRRRSSGILVQALACGRPVVVPAGTWMSQCMPADAGITFDGPDDLAAAITSAVDRIPHLRAAAAAVAPAWRDAHNPQKLVQTLLESLIGDQ